MSYQMEWKVNNRVLLITYEHELPNSDHQRFVVDLNEKLQEGIAPVHIIDDLSTLEKLPTNVAQMRELAKQLKDDKVGWFVMIQGNRVVGFLANIMTQLLGFKTTSRDNVEDAISFLIQHDETIAVEEAQQ